VSLPFNIVKFPSYIKFTPLIKEISAELDKNPQDDKQIYCICEDGKKCIYPSSCVNVNYKLFTNKGKFYIGWKFNTGVTFFTQEKLFRVFVI
jgi:hypothetical protein